MKRFTASPVTRVIQSLGLGLALIGTAQAASFTVDSSLGSAVLLSQPTSGSFSLAGQLSPAGDYVTPYQINSASVLFSFADDTANELVLTGQITNPYSPTAVTTRAILQTYGDPAESASVTIGSQSASGATQTYSVASHLDHTTVDWSYYANNCPGYVGPCNHQLFQGTSYYYVQVSGAKGSFDLGYDLDPTNLGILASTGVLSFNLGITGDLVLQSARLTLDITPNPLAVGPLAGPLAAVPEPETYALMLGGLGVLGACARRRRGRGEP